MRKYWYIWLFLLFFASCGAEQEAASEDLNYYTEAEASAEEGESATEEERTDEIEPTPVDLNEEYSNELSFIRLDIKRRLETNYALLDKPAFLKEMELGTLNIATLEASDWSISQVQKNNVGHILLLESTKTNLVWEYEFNSSLLEDAEFLINSVKSYTTNPKSHDQPPSI